MAQFIESLESRMLLSAVDVLKADAKAFIADVKALGKTVTANYKIIEGDVKAAGDLKISKAAIKALEVGGKVEFGVLSKGAKHTVALITANVKKGIAINKQLSKKPDNLKLQAKFMALETALQTNAANGLAAINADLAALNATNATNATAVASADPNDTQLATDVSNTVTPNAAAAATAVATAANTTLSTDVAALLTGA